MWPLTEDIENQPALSGNTVWNSISLPLALMTHFSATTNMTARPSPKAWESNGTYR